MMMMMKMMMVNAIQVHIATFSHAIIHSSQVIMHSSQYNALGAVIEGRCFSLDARQKSTILTLQ